jgi:hypothetical protein
MIEKYLKINDKSNNKCSADKINNSKTTDEEWFLLGCYEVWIL